MEFWRAYTNIIVRLMQECQNRYRRRFKEAVAEGSRPIVISGIGNFVHCCSKGTVMKSQTYVKPQIQTRRIFAYNCVYSHISPYMHRITGGIHQHHCEVNAGMPKIAVGADSKRRLQKAAAQSWLAALAILCIVAARAPLWSPASQTTSKHTSSRKYKHGV